MSQNDFTIANQGFPAFRADLNSALQALASLSAGATEPSTTFAYQLWYDSTTDILKVRNADNDAWINLFNFDQATDTVSVEGTDLVDDTTPQLGGDLASNGNDILFADNDKAIFGTGSDLQIYHDGTNSQIRDLGTGDLYIQASAAVSFTNTNASETYAVLNENGAVSLYYDNSAKFATASAGVAVTGRATGTLTTDNDLSFDMNASNYFKCTPTGTGTLTFTNITAGQSGNIWLDNSGGYAISAAASTYIASADLTTISTAGVYFLSYYSDGTNVMVSATPAVTSAGA